LYISYDGMLEPLGQSQVLAYLHRLTANRRIHLISFEKKSDWDDRSRRLAMEHHLAQAGIRWHPLRYHKRPTASATAYDVAVGTMLAIALAVRHQLNLVHARSYVAALIALSVKHLTGAKFLFDMRGLWADERVDGGLWPAHGRLYRMTKALERRFLLSADHVVTLTHASEREIRSFPYLADRAPPISVIPTCADLERFTIQGPSRDGPFVLGYVGSVGTWYLLDEMLKCFREVQAVLPDARLLIVNRSEQALIQERSRALGIDLATIEIVAEEHRDMPAQIGRMSAAMALIKPVYSKIASAPTKVAEYLGCGVPVLGNVGIGDMPEILEGQRVGVILDDFSNQALRLGVRRLVELAREPSIQERCRDTAIELFSLNRGVEAYGAIYDRLSGA
jgi:glycosyltransferase involved in cell wall biosynthesis